MAKVLTALPTFEQMHLFTDGSDIGNGTIMEIYNMEPQECLDWMDEYLRHLYGCL